MNLHRVIAAAALAGLVAAPVWAQQMKAVDGVLINIGIVKAIDAEHVDAQHGLHKGGHGSGMEHIVVALARERDGSRIGDAEVTIEVKDPKGAVQKKPAMSALTAGYPDYSEVFYFGWTGKYAVRVLIRQKGAAKPTEAVFAINHFL